eukprot:scaffold6520_cov32-Tisochrysis_lutea.AAC.4
MHMHATRVALNSTLVLGAAEWLWLCGWRITSMNNKTMGRELTRIPLGITDHRIHGRYRAAD